VGEDVFFTTEPRRTRRKIREFLLGRNRGKRRRRTRRPWTQASSLKPHAYFLFYCLGKAAPQSHGGHGEEESLLGRGEERRSLYSIFARISNIAALGQRESMFDVRTNIEYRRIGRSGGRGGQSRRREEEAQPPTWRSNPDEITTSSLRSSS
jgi:hypothetical protein